MVAARQLQIVQMNPTAVAKLFSGRVHYAWVVLVVMFCAMLAGVGVRAAPGVMILPLKRAFGWDVGTISGAVSINIILLGFTGPFLTGLVQTIRPETHDPGMSGTFGVRHGAVGFHDGTLAALSHLGLDGGNWCRRRRGRNGGGRCEPMVRRAERPGDGPAQRRQCGRTARISTAPGNACGALRLAGCRGRRDAGDCRDDPGHRHPAARVRPRISVSALMARPPIFGRGRNRAIRSSSRWQPCFAPRGHSISGC